MKKLDKLILKAFIGPFILTLLVVIFILLLQALMRYFEDFIGKGLGMDVFAELLGYFSVSVTPMALPLAVLLSSLMTFGNLGEHFELTAIKGAGISLLRAMQPIFSFVVLLTLAAFYFNNYVVPKANLKAYSLLYDVKKTKPTLSLKEGSFYNGLPGYSIKVNKKEDNGLLRDMIIYDHSGQNGNTTVILADSGRMESFNNDRYLRIVMYNGNRYSKGSGTGNSKSNKPDQYSRYRFDKNEMIFSMESFDMNETDEDLFRTNRLMRNIDELHSDLDSLSSKKVNLLVANYGNNGRYHTYHLKEEMSAPKRLMDLKETYRKQKFVRDSVRNAFLAEQKPGVDQKVDQSTKSKEQVVPVKNKVGKPKVVLPEGNKKPKKIEKTRRKPGDAKLEKQMELETRVAGLDPDKIAEVGVELGKDKLVKKALKTALNQAKYVKGNIQVQANQVKKNLRDINVFENEIYKKYAMAVSCLVMFLIGAPLGAIIKKGGLGMPVLVSILFFILFYVFLTTGEKWSREGVVQPLVGIWMANVVLLPFGLFFLNQARKDARVFEADFYAVLFMKLKKRFLSTRKK
ncbi:LptF/LptG family permease [Xanthovirga aplysinae]|uniref:LptF/LptG family permease n=1 Tax=Xanthovirga aplysinae TaxID=2529853 RepID=UPI0012BD7743|nr:LptF/LptG family permease [Xanthovirga aplysinae]MTI31563.1 YjgP/YjgQ family permease [Xanthovirga aplysinae]